MRNPWHPISSILRQSCYFWSTCTQWTWWKCDLLCLHQPSASGTARGFKCSLYKKGRTGRAGGRVKGKETSRFFCFFKIKLNRTTQRLHKVHAGNALLPASLDGSRLWDVCKNWDKQRPVRVCQLKQASIFRLWPFHFCPVKTTYF